MRFRPLLLAALPVLAQAGTVDFDAPRSEGFPHGLPTLPDDKAKADLPGIDFADSILEFDMKTLGDGMPGIRFHKQGDMAAEEFHLRTQPDCRAENDCVQYAPVIQGAMLWNVYPQYQSKAPVAEGWNHYKLVMSGRHLEVFVNDTRTVTARDRQRLEEKELHAFGRRPHPSLDHRQYRQRGPSRAGLARRVRRGAEGRTAQKGEPHLQG